MREYKRSDSSFLFCLKNKANMRPFKCPVKDRQNGEAICCYHDHGAVFGGCGRGGRGGGHDLFISSNANRNQLSSSNLGNTYQPPAGFVPGDLKTQSLLAGSHEFTPSEIEVFSVKRR